MQMQPDWTEERHKVNSSVTGTAASLEKPPRADKHTNILFLFNSHTNAY